MTAADSASESKKARELPTVLVIDDDLTHRKLMELIADHLQIKAHIVGSCGEAIAAMELLTFDIVLMDWRMPEIDGCFCTGKIRQREAETGRHTPIIAVTAGVMPGDKERCMNAGMDDYLPKPFTIEEISEVINKWIPQPSTKLKD